MGEAARPRPGAKYDATPCKILDFILKTVSAYSCKGVGGSADVDEQELVFTGRRLAQYHPEGEDTAP